MFKDDWNKVCGVKSFFKNFLRIGCGELKPLLCALFWVFIVNDVWFSMFVSNIF